MHHPVGGRVKPGHDCFGVKFSQMQLPCRRCPCQDYIPCVRYNVVETPAIPAPVSAYAPEFARRLGIILRMLAAIVARRLAREPRFIALVVPLWRRINRATGRFERLMAGLAAGRLPKPSRSGHG